MKSLNVKTTRIELIRIKGQIKIAKKGLNLLKMKRSSLVIAFLDLAKQIEEMKQNMKDSIQRSVNSNELADITLGKLVFDQIAHERSNIIANVSSKNIMGVKIPDITSSGEDKFTPVYMPIQVLDVINSFNTLFNLLLEVAEKENSLKQILYEIEKLNRRSNAIEHISIPNMVYQAKYIQARLDDMERDQIVSLKTIKGKLNESA